VICDLRNQDKLYILSPTHLHHTKFIFESLGIQNIYTKLLTTDRGVKKQLYYNKNKNLTLDLTRMRVKYLLCMACLIPESLGGFRVRLILVLTANIEFNYEIFSQHKKIYGEKDCESICSTEDFHIYLEMLANVSNNMGPDMMATLMISNSIVFWVVG